MMQTPMNTTPGRTMARGIACAGSLACCSVTALS
jgi:hypothetical protein